jgi:glutamate formiminotransferase/formiminotetrahydrofolate cyclodeaminase
MEIIKQITDQIESVEGVKLLDVDPGAGHQPHRGYVRGPAGAGARSRLASGAPKARELIDMSKHSGEHPRFGACDVCPLVPVANITMERRSPTRTSSPRLG